MKFKILILVVAMAITYIFIPVRNVYAAETQIETTTAAASDNQEVDSGESVSYNISYIVFLLSAVVGCLISLSLWSMWR